LSDEISRAHDFHADGGRSIIPRSRLSDCLHFDDNSRIDGFCASGGDGREDRHDEADRGMTKVILNLPAITAMSTRR
jgi:hypothetical protein